MAIATPVPPTEDILMPPMRLLIRSIALLLILLPLSAQTQISAIVMEQLRGCWAWLPLHQQVADSDLIVVGEIVDLHAGGELDRGIISIAQVLKGDASSERCEIRFPGTERKLRTSVDICFDKGARGVWLLKKVRLGAGEGLLELYEHEESLERVPLGAGEEAFYTASLHPVQFQPVALAPLVKMMVAGIDDERIAILYTGMSRELDEEVLSYIRTIGPTGEWATKLALDALRHPDSQECRALGADQLAALVRRSDGPDPRRCLSRLLAMATGGGSSAAYSRSRAYHAARTILIERIGIEERRLPTFSRTDLEDSAAATRRAVAERAIGDMRVILEELGYEPVEDERAGS